MDMSQAHDPKLPQSFIQPNYVFILVGYEGMNSSMNFI